MESKNLLYQKGHSRRKFLGKVAATAGITGLASPLFANFAILENNKKMGEADAWFKKIKGSHRVVYDASEPHMGLPFIWTWAFYMTNNQTGTQDNDMTAMVVLRHNAIPFALKDNLWAKYKFGEMFEITDNISGKSALRNPFYEPKEGDFPIPGIDGIKKMQDRGAMLCVCDLALTVYSGMAAQKINGNAEAVKKDWLNGILPNIQVVPSGVWALTRAQENGCAYIYAGG